MNKKPVTNKQAESLAIVFMTISSDERKYLGAKRDVNKPNSIITPIIGTSIANM